MTKFEEKLLKIYRTFKRNGKVVTDEEQVSATLNLLKEEIEEMKKNKEFNKYWQYDRIDAYLEACDDLLLTLGDKKI